MTNQWQDSLRIYAHIAIRAPGLDCPKVIGTVGIVVM